MSDKNLKQRSDIPKEYKWNIEAMYPDESKWEADVKACLDEAEKFSEFSGKLTSDSATLASALKMRDSIWQRLEHAYVYAAMRKDEDNRIDKYQAMNDKCGSAIAKVSASMSFFTPELLEASEDKIMGFIEENADLKEYEFMLKSVLREKAHILSASEENIMAQMSEVTGATNDVFKMLNNADMTFGTIIDEDGDEVRLQDGSKG